MRSSSLVCLSVEKNPSASVGDAGDTGSILGSGRSPGESSGNSLTPVFLPGEFHGQRSPAGFSPWGCKELYTTEHACTLLQKYCEDFTFKILHCKFTFFIFYEFIFY